VADEAIAEEPAEDAPVVAEAPAPADEVAEIQVVETIIGAAEPRTRVVSYKVPVHTEPQAAAPADEAATSEEPEGADASPAAAEDEPAVDEPAADEPAIDEPAADEPETDEPAAYEPAEDEPAADEAVGEEAEVTTSDDKVAAAEVTVTLVEGD
jgi:hypothetical protein